MPFVSGDGSTREIITIEDARFDLAKQILKQLDLDLKQLSKEERAKPEIIFQQLCRLVAQQFKESSDERINSLSEREGRKTDTGHYLVPLEVFALAQVGNCRHMSLLTAVLLGLLAQTGQLDAGSIRVCTSMDLNGRSHMWVRYHNKANGDYFLIDPTNATEQQVVLLNSLENRKQLVHYYAKERKLLQLLTRQLFNIASETKQMDFLKGLDFNIELRVLAQFIKTGQHLTLDPKLLKPYLCPLSGKLPSYPVRCPELGYLKVYDKEALEAELKSKAIAGQYKTVEFELAINPLLELFYLIQKHNKLIKVEKFIKEEEPEQPKEESFALAEDTEDCILLQDLLKTDKTCEAGKEGKAQAGSWGAFMNFFGSGVTEKEDPEHKPGPQLGN